MAAAARTILRRLEKAYGPMAPPKKLNPLDELILTILSQNTSDVNRDRAWTSLCARFATWDEVSEAATSDVADAIRPGGLAETKAPRIQAVLQAIRERRGTIDLAFLRRQSDEAVREFLRDLPGVGPKTVACVMAFSLQREVIPVDTHVHRIALRLGLIPPKTNAERAHVALEELVRPEDRLPLHVALITHGRRVCTALRPRCDACVLEDLCPRVGVSEWT